MSKVTELYMRDYDNNEIDFVDIDLKSDVVCEVFMNKDHTGYVYNHQGKYGYISKENINLDVVPEHLFDEFKECANDVVFGDTLDDYLYL